MQNPEHQAPPRQLLILGSTGSIGQQTLEVVDALPQQFAVWGLAGNRNAKLLIDQARRYQPKRVAVVDDEAYTQVRQALDGTGIEVHQGPKALVEAAQHPEVDLVVAAIVGFAGLRSAHAALEASKPVALANKETLVVAGQLMTQAANRHNATLLPVDSEHSAIWQCLVGEDPQDVEALILTASGGPFRGKTAGELAQVTKAQALKHPNWSMGAKITIDSATLMNKGLEVMEARWLFDLPGDRIEVVVHPQSVLHSLVRFRDGSVKAQLGPADMRLPIQYALTYPKRPAMPFPRFSLFDRPTLTFEPPDTATFRTLPLAYKAMKLGGTAPCALNAANEAAVAAFLDDRIPFAAIFDVLEEALDRAPYLPHPTLDDLMDTDAQVRRQVNDRLG